ncbi:ganglioside GM2 activator-like [Centruroides sculpturatus]|uniref:ganglioside GM2 activator-like n=1 Tax=Centruroides sculpturatus TaxID=218467 RepID=UPI000C6ED54A|nr:ganglioside GM2 activator-like [Centruroides sculpturatus]
MGKLLFNFLLLTLAIYPTLAVPSTLAQFIRSSNETAELFLKLISEPQILDREWSIFYKFEGIPMRKGDKPLVEFSWSNCAPSAPVRIKSLHITPDPINFPGDITFDFDIVLKTEIAAPFKLDVDMKKKVHSVWVEVPCKDHIGTCNFPDICVILDIFSSIGCPFKADEYKLNSTTIKLPEIHLPDSISTGDYKVRINGSHDEKTLFCYDFKFSLHVN